MVNTTKIGGSYAKVYGKIVMDSLVLRIQIIATQDHLSLVIMYYEIYYKSILVSGK